MRPTALLFCRPLAVLVMYAGENFLRHLVEAAVETYPHIPVVMHQDHGNSPATCYSAIRQWASPA